MRKLSRQVRSFLLLDAFFFLFCITGIFQLSQKADLPFSVNNENSFFYSSENGSTVNSIHAGDTLISFDGMPFREREELETYLDSKSIGDSIAIAYSHNGRIQSVEVRLTEYYTFPFIVSNAFAGLLFIAFGIFVLLKCPTLRPAKIFHWGSIGIAIMLLTTWGKYNSDPAGLSFITRTVFHFSYVFTPALFFHFALTFPKNREQRFKLFLGGLYTTAILMALVNIYFFGRMLPTPDENSIANYLSVFFMIRLWAIINILASILIFIISYFRTKNEVEKKKLKWLLFGFLIGPLSFIALWNIPQLIVSAPLMPEILIPLLMLSIPITFTIAIVRYHLMDIDLLIRRSIVYSIVIFFLIIIYISSISILSSQVSILNFRIPSIIAAILIALLFEPIRRKAQVYVDKKFFRLQYDFREALKNFIRNISEINTVPDLAEMMVKKTREFIPVKKIGFFLLSNNYLMLKAHFNFDLLLNHRLPFDSSGFKSELNLPLADPSKIEAGITFETGDITLFKRWGIELVIPVRTGDGTVYAFFVLGEKKSEGKFTIEDIDLLNNVASSAASTISRIYLQEELIRKNLEAEKLEELNKQKTMFVSTVSHDLKTPLASIKVFSEMLKNDTQATDKQKDYLHIIEGEADRLTRLINNVLGFARIEKGIRQYKFESISLNSIVEKTLEALNYQLKMKGFNVQKKISPINWMVSADPDAVMEALINVVANAIKFSLKEKEVSISTYRLENFSCVEVRDKGIGINPDDLKNLFKPFFRSQIAGNMKISGTGLGLSIIKHVMDAHKAKIEVQSIPEEGTAFILKFPIEKYESSYFDDQSLISISLTEENIR